MNRRIKRNRAVPIHMTLPPSLLDEIDARLSHKMSRSNWIRGACEIKLDKDVTEVNDLTDKQLVNILLCLGLTPGCILSLTQTYPLYHNILTP